MTGHLFAGCLIELSAGPVLEWLIVRMPRRLLLALLALVAAPLVLLGWLSASATRESQQRAQEKIVSLLHSRLVEIDQSASQLFDSYVRRVTVALENEAIPINALKKLRRSEPVVRQGIYVSANGQLLFPPRPSLDDPDAAALYAALPGMISGRPTIGNESKPNADTATYPNAKPQNRSSIQVQSKTPATTRNPKRYRGRSAAIFSATNPVVPTATGESFWQVWYLDQGMQLILWLPRTDGAAAGVILERPRWASDLTAALPDSVGSDDDQISRMPGFTTLVDETKQVIYRWGDEGECTQPTTSLSLSVPLSAWQWEFHANEELVPRASAMPLLLSLAGVGVVLLALGAYVLSSVQRQMRTARNRVSFAGQVSHELRTPLTNIRLYAELAESDLEKLPESETRVSVERRLKVIDTESKRLGRLVSGVLEIMRNGKKQRGPRLALANPDQLIEETLSQFSPSFENAKIEIERDTAANKDVQMDADIFEMVLVNLLSNVEKYAATGKHVLVKSRIDDSELIVSVADRGPGISGKHRRMIFRPFARLDDSISAPSGTGIGLTIARNAAARHGGQLNLLTSENGACFELRIPITETGPQDGPTK